MAQNDDEVRRSVKMAELEFQEAPMDDYYSHPVAGIFSRMRVKHILKLFPDIKGKRILDVGCEAGYVSQRLSEAGANVVSFDICYDALQSFKKKSENDNTKCKIFQAFAQAIPLKEESIDGVICTEVIEHAPHPEIILKEISRVIKKDGRTIITFPNEKLREKVYGIIKLLGINTDIEKDVTMFYYTPEEIERLCGNYFKIISRYSMPFFFPLTRFILCVKK